MSPDICLSLSYDLYSFEEDLLKFTHMKVTSEIPDEEIAELLAKRLPVKSFLVFLKPCNFRARRKVTNTLRNYG